MLVLLVFRKSGAIRSCSSFEYPIEYKISWSYIGASFASTSGSWNVHLCGMVAAIALKVMTSRSLSMA
jgi:hypothetical protein